MVFRLEIELGNDAMRTPNDVRLAVERSLQQQTVMLVGLLVGHVGAVHDENGNTVGRWRVDAQ